MDTSQAEPAVSGIVVTTSPTLRYDRARKNLDRHPNILAAYMASGT